MYNENNELVRISNGKPFTHFTDSDDNKNNAEKKSLSSAGFVKWIADGIVEPIAGLITILLASVIVPVLPYLLSFAAGAMIYVVVEELIPESQEGEHSNIGTIGVAIGFVIMIIMTVYDYRRTESVSIYLYLFL